MQIDILFKYKDEIGCEAERIYPPQRCNEESKWQNVGDEDNIKTLGRISKDEELRTLEWTYIYHTFKDYLSPDDLWPDSSCILLRYTPVNLIYYCLSLTMMFSTSSISFVIFTNLVLSRSSGSPVITIWHASTTLIHVVLTGLGTSMSSMLDRCPFNLVIF